MTKLAEPMRVGVMTGQFGPQRLGRAGLTPGSANVLTLSQGGCWALLGTDTLGRLAIVIDGRPRIFPVNYAAGAVVFRTEPWAKLRYGPGAGAWSVTVVGVLKEITDAADFQSRGLRRMAVEPLAPGQKIHGSPGPPMR